ncbi:MAG: MaoC family dehydratase N-terminal domain-containing protein [Micropruina sp.]
MISDAHAGKAYPPTDPYTISSAKIAEFAAALGDAQNSAYGGDRPIAPPTMAVVLSSAAWGAMFADPDLDLSLSRTVHTDQRFVWERPLRAGDTVTAALQIEKVRARGTTAFITISVRLVSQADQELVCTATSTLMHTWPAEAVA